MGTVRNKTDRTSLIQRLQRLKGDEKPLWGKMNAGQMVSHLVQAGELPFEATLPDKSTFLARSIIKPLILYVLPMPKEVKTSAEMNQQEKGRPPVEFSLDKQLAVELINKIGDLSTDDKCQHHPFFGKMTAKEWAVIAYKHTDHHLRQFGV